jgi:hypothetical protein
MSQKKKFNCCFELPDKGVHLNITTSPQYDNVAFSTYFHDVIQVSVCLREKEVDELIEILQGFKMQKATYYR